MYSLMFIYHGDLITEFYEKLLIKHFSPLQNSESRLNSINLVYSKELWEPEDLAQFSKLQSKIVSKVSNETIIYQYEKRFKNSIPNHT
ncbi:hypothetical protein BpHYR1_005626 [Brachionus plicatilis]|uniref:Uncharacterized protein n=1 Tax=Brachionus plicatilis TaxID=10195 RepID=A0A3M7T8B8_BRAPC|nr:hypothetical protein BpHYR1_005626 [Brachionus plicatilis]